MKMQAPPHCREVSHGGRVYRADPEGVIEVPESARTELEALIAQAGTAGA